MRVSLVIAVIALVVSGCGYSSLEGEMVGQVKSVSHTSNLLCADYDRAFISLGVFRNGVGSMSTQDVGVWMPDSRVTQVMREAARAGAIVRLQKKTYRNNFCKEDHEISVAEILK